MTFDFEKPITEHYPTHRIEPTSRGLHALRPTGGRLFRRSDPKFQYFSVGEDGLLTHVNPFYNNVFLDDYDGWTLADNADRPLWEIVKEARHYSQEHGRGVVIHPDPCPEGRKRDLTFPTPLESGIGIYDIKRYAKGLLRFSLLPEEYKVHW
ncbi:hypothetical protein KW805_03880 [Candidatus Pacearchaeota archaeon]|nr:hypothetical protein [Candidatus Pacearchaeota archaeon]